MVALKLDSSLVLPVANLVLVVVLVVECMYSFKPHNRMIETSRDPYNYHLLSFLLFDAGCGTLVVTMQLSMPIDFHDSGLMFRKLGACLASKQIEVHVDIQPILALLTKRNNRRFHDNFATPFSLGFPF